MKATYVFFCWTQLLFTSLFCVCICLLMRELFLFSLLPSHFFNILWWFFVLFSVFMLFFMFPSCKTHQITTRIGVRPELIVFSALLISIPSSCVCVCMMVGLIVDPLKYLTSLCPHRPPLTAYNKTVCHHSYHYYYYTHHYYLYVIFYSTPTNSTYLNWTLLPTMFIDDKKQQSEQGSFHIILQLFLMQWATGSWPVADEECVLF